MSVKKEWSEDTLKEYADKWLVSSNPDRYIKLLTKEEFKKLKKGTKLLDRRGREVSKGVDTEDDPPVIIFGRMPYGTLI